MEDLGAEGVKKVVLRQFRSAVLARKAEERRMLERAKEEGE
jgi:hypothetical protein